jgi:hypothetical protein
MNAGPISVIFYESLSSINRHDSTLPKACFGQNGDCWRLRKHMGNSHLRFWERMPAVGVAFRGRESQSLPVPKSTPSDLSFR